jgi:hypothetical protein
MENLARLFSLKQQNIPKFLKLGDVEEVAFARKERENQPKASFLNELTPNCEFSLFLYFLVSLHL